MDTCKTCNLRADKRIECYASQSMAEGLIGDCTRHIKAPDDEIERRKAFDKDMYNDNQ